MGELQQVQLPEGWESKEFEKCLEKVQRATKIPKKKFLDKGSYPIISQESDFINGYWSGASDVLEIEKPVVIFGDHTRIVKYVDFPFVQGADGVKVLQPIDNIDARFFYYQLQSISLADLGYARHYRLLKQETVVIPPLETQKQIVAVLDKAFAAIDVAKANIEKNLQNAKELFQSKLNQIFTQKGKGWEEKKLGEVCVVERGSSPRPIKNFQTDSDDGVNWIKIGDTKNVEKYIYSTKEKITTEGSLKSRFVDVGDFILSNSMSFGRPYIMKTQGYIHDGWFVLRLPDDIDTEFFWYLLVSPYTKNQFESLASGAIVKNISGDLVKKAILPIAPPAKQKQIVQQLDIFSAQTKQLEVQYQQKLDDLDELKKSILQKAFAGELTQGSNDV